MQLSLETMATGRKISKEQRLQEHALRLKCINLFSLNSLSSRELSFCSLQKFTLWNVLETRLFLWKISDMQLWGGSHTKWLLWGEDMQKGQTCPKCALQSYNLLNHKNTKCVPEMQMQNPVGSDSPSLSVSCGKPVHLSMPGWCVPGHVVTQFVPTLVSLHCPWLQEQVPLGGSFSDCLRSLKFKEIDS